MPLLLALLLIPEQKAPPRLPRDEVLLIRRADGTVAKAASPGEWAARRAEIVRGMESFMGPFPGKEKRVALDLKIDEETDCGTYVRRLVSYSSEPGCRTPAYLCVPKAALGGAKAPGVLCLHPTEINIGPKVVVGLGGKPHRQYAAELAEKGCVTIAPAYPTMGGYDPDLKRLGHASGTMKAIWDNSRALDLLDTLPFVKPGARATIGHSLGGHNSVFTAVFDDRLKVVVSSCGLDSFSDYYDGNPKSWDHGRGWCQDRYMARLATYKNRLSEIPADFHEMIAAIAPRTVFICAPLRDSNFRHASVDKVAAAARQAFALHGATDSLVVEHPDADHDFPDASRQKAYDIILRELR
ncbi:MAG: dienelactone hydrolase family protein [Planctomycetota bacterium]